MNSQRQLDSSQLILLREIGAMGVASLLKVRSKLAWELGKYATALHSLEESGLIRRDGLKATCSEAGMGLLQRHGSAKATNPPVGSQVHSFASQVKAPQLPVNELWLPNLQKFLGAIGVHE